MGLTEQQALWICGVIRSVRFDIHASPDRARALWLMDVIAANTQPAPVQAEPIEIRRDDSSQIGDCDRFGFEKQ